jgi:serine phosphatase RsbU (regulator of sigma subunit)
MTASNSPSDEPPAGAAGQGAEPGKTGRFEPGGRMRIRRVGAGALLLILMVLFQADMERSRENVFDVYQRISPREVERYWARIVEIDEASLDRYGPWPWPRFLLAELAQAIFDKGALAIGFDAVFPEPDLHGMARFFRIYPELPEETRNVLTALPDPDRVFARRVGRLPVVLGRSGVLDRRDAGPRDPATLPIEADFTGDPPPPRLLSYPAAIANIEALDAAAAGQGLLNGTPDSDGVVRSVPLLAMVAGRPTPALALELLRVAVDADGFALESRAERLAAVTLGDRRIPTEPDGRLRLHFSPPHSGRTVSAVSLLEGALPDDAFRGSVVLVGAAALGLEQVVSTPVAAESFGADVHAQTVETILGETWLQRPVWMEGLEWGLAVLLAAIAIAAFPLFSPVLALITTLTVLVLIFAASFSVFTTAGLLMDPVVPSAGAGFPALFVLGMMLVEADRRRRALRDSLMEARLRAARVSGELAAARDIQLGMLPSPEALRGLPPAVELAAHLESTRFVGGALYDAVLLDRARLFFMIGDVTGKGVPAALFMALSKALAKSAVLRDAGLLSAAVSAANHEMSRENPGDFFVAAIFGVLDLETGEAELCNAGHEDPIRLGAGGGAERLAMEGGPPLCAVDDYPYPVESFRLAPGDMLVLATDGASEAQDPAGAFFGSARLVEVLSALPRPVSAQIAVHSVTEAVHAFHAGGEPSDDLTVLALRYLGPEG